MYVPSGTEVVRVVNSVATFVAFDAIVATFVARGLVDATFTRGRVIRGDGRRGDERGYEERVGHVTMSARGPTVCFVVCVMNGVPNTVFRSYM